MPSYVKGDIQEDAGNLPVDQVPTMRILMTGTRGFIGGRVLRYFCQKHPQSQIFRFIRQRPLTPGEIRCDFRYPVTHDRLPPIDYVFHIGAWVDVGASIQQPDECLTNNILGTYHMLEYCRRFQPRLKMFMYLSTNEVYGPCVDTVEAYDESAAHFPTTPYAASKAAAEDLVTAWNASMGIPSLIINCMNVIGPGQRENKFVPAVLRGLRENSRITVHGEKDNPGFRRYMSPRDVARAFEFLITHGRRGQKYHIAGDEEITNEGMVRRLEKLTGLTARIQYQPFELCRPGHGRSYSLDTHKMNVLGWHPEDTIETILEEIVKANRESFHPTWY